MWLTNRDSRVGPGWTRIRKEAGISDKDAATGGQNIPLALLGWFAGCATIWSALFTVGNFLYGRTLVALLLLGALFGYTTVYPAALEFLIGYGAQFRPTITIGEYTDLFLTTILGLGLVFELPVVLGLLGVMGIVSARWLWRNLRYSILVIFIIAGIITPTADILNMCIFAAPMVGLYLLSIAIVWAVDPKRRKTATVV